MTQTRLRENTIGEGIYNRIKEYDIISRKVHLSNLSAEHKALYVKYKNMINKRNSLNNGDNREKQNKLAIDGMKKIRAERPKEQQKEQRKPYDEKYQAKRRERAVITLQRQYRANKKAEGEKIAKEILNDIFDNSLNYKLENGELKKKRGRKIT